MSIGGNGLTGGILLLIEPGMTTTRELVERLAEHAPLAWVSGDPFPERQAWAQKYCSHDPLYFRYGDGDAALDAIAGELEHRGLTVAGALTLAPPAVPFTNRLQHRLGLPPIAGSPEAALRDKADARVAFAAGGVSQPEFAVIRGGRLPDAIPDFPLVMKPADFTDSLGVRIVHDRAELDAHLPLCATADFAGEDLRDKYAGMSSTVLVEGFIDGDDYSVECVCSGGEVHIIAATRRGVRIDDGYFTTTSHLLGCELDLLPAEAREAARAVVVGAHRALGMRNGFTNTDIRVAGDRVWLMEVNTRLAGAAIATMLTRRFGDWLFDSIARVALGESTTSPDRSERPAERATYLYTRSMGRLRWIDSAEPPDVLVKKASEGELICQVPLTGSARVGFVLTGDGRAVDPARYFSIQHPVTTATVRGEHPIAVFVANAADVDRLAMIDRDAWGDAAASNQTMLARVSAFPDGTLLALDARTGEVLGLSTSVPLADFDPADVQPWTHYAHLATSAEHLESLDTPHVAYGLNLSVRPGSPGGTASALKTAAAWHFAGLGFERLVSAARIPGFAAAAAAGTSIDDYYRQVVAGEVESAAFGACTRAGGVAQRWVADYYEDPDSLDHCIILVHDLATLGR